MTDFFETVLPKLIILLKVLGFLIASTILGIIIAYMIGLFIPQNNFIERRKSFNFESQKVWKNLQDIESYPKWKPNVNKVETLGVNEENLPRWREIYDDGFSKEFSITNISSNKSLTIEENNNTVRSVTWVIKLTKFQSKTVLHLKKYSRINQPFLRFENRYLEDGLKGVDRYLLSLNERLKNLER